MAMSHRPHRFLTRETLQQAEERDLAAVHGAAFAQYRKDVPMIFPAPGRRSR